VPDARQSASLNCPAQTLFRTTWGRSGDLQIGSLAGTVHAQSETQAAKNQQAATPWTWPIRSADSIWLWLNIAGEGLIWGKNERFFLKPGMFAMTGGGPEGLWQCIRHAGSHRLDWVEIPREWLRSRVGGETEALRGGLAEWLRVGGPVAFCGLMGVWERDLCEALTKAGNQHGPPRFLAEARVLEWAAARFFEKPISLGSRTTPPPNDPVKRAIHHLRERLDQSLDLPALAKAVGISPHHLSRRVKAETGITLLQHLRQLRVSHACDALASGRMNVTEAALEVGYQSLSHFSKAFREETGLTPREWLVSRKGR
jgi:AraC-like DNA-binding protein